jgi:hypothetical protein
MKNLLKNWKTTLAGLITLAASLAPIWAPGKVSSKIQSTATAFAAAGLIASKDQDQ